MNEQKTIKTESLYVLRPSQIVNVEGNIHQQKTPGISHPIEIVNQNITFENVPDQIVIAKSVFMQKRYIPVMTEEEKTLQNIDFYGAHAFYHQSILETTGLQERQKNSSFVGIFKKDILTLQELVTLISSPKRLFLKKTSKVPLPSEYSIEQLQELKEYLKAKAPEIKSQTTTRRYSVIREPITYQYIDGLMVSSRTAYVGTEEDPEVQLTKILTRPLP